LSIVFTLIHSGLLTPILHFGHDDNPGTLQFLKSLFLLLWILYLL